MAIPEDQPRHTEEGHTNDTNEAQQNTKIPSALTQWARRLMMGSVFALPFISGDNATNQQQEQAALEQIPDTPDTLLTPGQRDALLKRSVPPGLPEDFSVQKREQGRVEYSYNNQRIVGTYNEKQQLINAQIGSVHAQYTEPIDENDVQHALWNLYQASVHIHNHKNAKTITSWKGIGAVRLQGSVDDVTYIASPWDVLRVSDEPSMMPQLEERLHSLGEEEEEISKKYICLIPHAFSWNLYLRGLKGEARKRRIEDVKRNMERIAEIGKEMKYLQRRKDAIVLRNEKNGETVYEQSTSSKSFSRLYTHENETTKIVEVARNRLSSELIEQQNMYRRFYHRGVIVSMKEGDNTVSYNKEQNRTMWTKGRQTDVYENEKFLYRIERNTDPENTGWNSYRLFNAKEGRFYDPLTTEAQEVAKTVRTKEEYSAWEEIMRINERKKIAKIDWEYERAMRACGKRIYGIDHMESQIEELLGNHVFINTEKSPNTRDETFYPATMNRLALSMKIIMNALQIYPPHMLKRLQIHTLDILDGGHNNKGFGTTRGRSGSNRVILSIADPAHLAETVHHELFHEMDRDLETLDDETWNLPFEKEKNTLTPDDYASSYGRTNAIEDKAECARRLMTQREGLLTDFYNNPVLKQKREWVENVYYAFSRGKMDRQFWQDLRSEKEINAIYWKQRKTFTKTKPGELKRQELKQMEEIERRREQIQASEEDEHKQNSLLAELYLTGLNFSREDLRWKYYRRLYNTVGIKGSRMPPQDAARYMMKALKRNPKEMPLWLYLRLIDTLIDTNNYPEARTVFNQYKQHYGGDAPSVSEIRKKLREGSQ